MDSTAAQIKTVTVVERRLIEFDCINLFFIVDLRAISSPENFVSFIGMDQDPACYFQNGLYMWFLFLNVIAF